MDQLESLVRDVAEIKSRVKLLENWIQQKNEKRDYQGARAFIYSVVGGVVVALSMFIF